MAPVLVGIFALAIGVAGGYALRMFSWDGTGGDEFKSLSQKQERTDAELTKAIEERDAALEELQSVRDRADMNENDLAEARESAQKWEQEASDAEERAVELQEELDNVREAKEKAEKEDKADSDAQGSRSSD